MPPPWVTEFWGKARPRSDSGPVWHPLAYHSLDVAAAMAAMLDIRPAWARAVASAAGLPVAEARHRLVLAAALHDLGKFACNFQQKAPELRRRLQPDAPWKSDIRGHGEIGAGLWRSWPAAPRVLSAWARGAFAHHGAPVPTPPGVETAASAASCAQASAYGDAVLALLGPPSEERGRSGEAVWMVAGLVVLADWIGSNQAWFAYAEPDHDLAAYWETAREQAAHAVAEASLAEAGPATQVDLATLLGADAGPTPLQAWAEAEAPVAEPQLYVVEDLTGAGKTEAALILAHRLIRSGAAEGLYWALPTMATANGLHARLQASYRRLFEAEGAAPSLVLAHGARDLNAGFQASIGRERDARYGAGTEQDISAEAFCAVFVAEDRKKTFLAQVGVGTIDQALLAVLPARHQTLRLAGLARRVLVVDEAHAYDAYMSEGLERLLQFHARHGGSAIVLSATLTSGQRARLAEAYGGALPIAVGADAPFPFATHVAGGHVRETPLAASRGSRRDLACRRLETPDEAMAALLARALAGGCGVYVRNTVADAVEAYAVLRTAAPPGVTVELFHARFAIGDRLDREHAAMARYGKASTAGQRQGRILVATQVVEQSLDLDFDAMATDLCPMDLLIQRAGRLHRHDRSGRPPPELWIVGPEATDDVPPDWYARSFPRATHVYNDTGQLWRTMRIAEAQGLRLASGSPRALIEPVFGADSLPTPAALDRASDEARAERQGMAAVAHLNFLRFGRFERDAGAWDADVRTPTRLGQETVTVRLARWSDGRLSPWREEADPERAWRLSEIALDAGRAAETLAPAGAAPAIEALRRTWPRAPDALPILALTPDGAVWAGQVRSAKRETPTRVTYCAELGFAFM